MRERVVGSRANSAFMFALRFVEVEVEVGLVVEGNGFENGNDGVAGGVPSMAIVVVVAVDVDGDCDV